MAGDPNPDREAQMRSLKRVCARWTVRSAWRIGLALGLALAPAPVRAEDAESLRRELQDVKSQFESMKAGYQKAIDALEKRIESLESRPSAPAAPAPTPSPGEARSTEGPSTAQAGGLPSAMDLARPRQPFGLYTQRGSGQLLFDIGVAGDFVGDFTSSGVQNSNTCTFPGGCNRVFPRTAEIDLFGQVDPYARAIVIFSAGQEFDGGSSDFNVQLEEAYLTLLTLPFGSQLKLGKMLVRFGLLNPIHEHDQPQTDRPDVLTQFFGQEALNESGGELSWVAPLPFFLEAVAGVFNGDNDVAFGSSSFRLPLVTGRLRTFFEGDLGAVQLGASGAFGYTADAQASWIWGADVKYKFTPEGWQWPLFTAAGEALFAVKPARRHGFYVYGEVQPWRRWLAGLRYDWTQYLASVGSQWGIEPYIAFAPSEFLRFRLGYKYTDRGSTRVALNPDGYPRIANELFLQASFFLGAHQTHGF